MDYAGPPLLISVAPAIVSVYVFSTGSGGANTKVAVILLAFSVLLIFIGIWLLLAYRTVELDFDRQLLTATKHRLIGGSVDTCALDSFIIARCKVQQQANRPYRYSGLLLAADSIHVPLLYACGKGDDYADRAVEALHPRLSQYVIEDVYNVCLEYW